MVELDHGRTSILTEVIMEQHDAHVQFFYANISWCCICGVTGPNYCQTCYDILDSYDPKEHPNVQNT